MDIEKALRELYDEKKRLEQVIASLEELDAKRGELPVAFREKRRGRKFMDAQARREVSERMKRYWAMRRKQADGAAG